MTLSRGKIPRMTPKTSDCFDIRCDLKYSRRVVAKVPNVSSRNFTADRRHHAGLPDRVQRRAVLRSAGERRKALLRSLLPSVGTSYIAERRSCEFERSLHRWMPM